VLFEFGDDDAGEDVLFIESLISVSIAEREFMDLGVYHKAQVRPLVEEVSVHVNAIRFRKIAGNQVPNLWQVLCFLCRIILGIVYAWRSCLHILTHGRRCAGVLKLGRRILVVGEKDLQAKMITIVPWVWACDGAKTFPGDRSTHYVLPPLPPTLNVAIKKIQHWEYTWLLTIYSIK
jgi:hypothetical protein